MNELYLKQLLAYIYMIKEKSQLHKFDLDDFEDKYDLCEEFFDFAKSINEDSICAIEYGERLLKELNDKERTNDVD